MKSNLLFLSFLITGVLFSGCSKDDDNNGGDNWAASVAGTYIGAGTGTYCGSPLTSSTTVITRISNNMLNFQVTTSSFAQQSYCLDSVLMSSATTFSVNENEGCYASDAATGGGSFNGNSVSYSISYSNNNWCDITVTGSK